MFYKKTLCITGLIFLLVSTGSVFAVEPTTFPTNKIAPNKRTNRARPTAAPENIFKDKGTPGKQTVETAVPVKPKTAPKKAPRTRKK